jgi:hypothetical protein
MGVVAAEYAFETGACADVGAQESAASTVVFA